MEGCFNNIKYLSLVRTQYIKRMQALDVTREMFQIFPLTSLIWLVHRHEQIHGDYESTEARGKTSCSVALIDLTEGLPNMSRNTASVLQLPVSPPQMIS